MNCKQITDLREIQEYITRIKLQGEDWLTNFYVEEGRLQKWLAKGQVMALLKPEAMALLRQRDGFAQCYFVASETGSLKEAINELLATKQKPLVTDVLGEAKNLHEILLAAGWQPYISLQRIIKINPLGQIAKPVPEANYARPGDESQIQAMLTEDIDPFGEQVPDLDEIAERIAAHEVLVIRDEVTGELKAFFSFLRQGATVTGRFLCTRRKYREGGWGLDLSDMFFGLHADARRIIGWVREDNKRNLRLYKLQGYQKDRLRDEVFIYKGAK